MDKRAESLAQADEEEFAFQSAKSANLGASAMMARWHRRAQESFGDDNEITQHYAAVLKTLKEQYENIWDWEGDKKVLDKAEQYALELGKKYGGIKEKDITPKDHLTRFKKPDGPR